MTNRKRTSQDLGLEAGLVFSRYFLKTDHLHYGYWPENLEVDVANLRRAQDYYCELIICHIPENVRYILDVGCGSGGLARRLTELGYAVDCVSPSPFLAEEASQHLDGRARVFECRYEDLVANRHYDLVLFSESFQYVELNAGLSKTASIMTDGGHFMICDLFRKETEGTCKIGGGKCLRKFHKALAHYPFEIVEDLDITEQTAPTMDLANEVCVEVLRPIWRSLFSVLESRYPKLMKIIRWKYKNKIGKIERKYFQGERGAEHFRHFKTYRLMLIRDCGRKTFPADHIVT